MRMGLSFEAKVREAERTINTLIEAINREGGSVYISEPDGPGFCDRLTRPIEITYWVPVKQREEE